MTHAIEMALLLFSPKGALHEPAAGRQFNALGRDEFIGALQVAAKNNPQGLQFLMADHLGDEQALASLLTHFSATLDSDEAGGMAMESCCAARCLSSWITWYFATLTMTRSAAGPPW